MSFVPNLSPLTWMYRISTNWCLNQLRNRQSQKAKLDQHGSSIFSLEDLEKPQIDEARLRDLLELADDETRACVVYTYFDDCSRQETALL